MPAFHPVISTITPSFAAYGALLVLILTSAALLVISARGSLQKQRAQSRELSASIQQMRDETRRRLLFLNALSHDLRTPLNQIALQAHVIDQALANRDTSALTTATGSIRSSADLAAHILGSLLQYAQTAIDQNVITPVNLKELLRQAAEPFRAAAEEKKLAFSIAAPNDVVLHTDTAKLQQILANLLANALKFTTHGSIALRAHKTQNSELGATRDFVAIEVTDTGPGIPPEQQSRIFLEFFQANNPSRDARLGLGLGLVIARRLAQQLAATLTCSSNPVATPSGTTFTLILPLSAPPNK